MANFNKRAYSLLEKAKALAIEYRNLTKKPLGITGEVAEYEAARILGYEICEARTCGYDLIDHKGKKVQVKGRVILNKKSGQRVPSIKHENKEWHYTLLVLLNEEYEVQMIYKAARKPIIEFLDATDSKARKERRSMSISQFKKLAGEPIWFSQSN